MFEYIENKIKKKNIYILKVGILGLDVYMDNIFKNYDLRKIQMLKNNLILNSVTYQNDCV